MNQPVPGDLVVYKLKWTLDSDNIGMVVSSDSETAYVMWSRPHGPCLRRHILYALQEAGQPQELTVGR